MHGNFPQGLFAVAAGVVFGYIASEYSIRWSIALHILNNVIFSEALGKLAKLLPETAASVVEYGTLIGFAVLTCVIFAENGIRLLPGGEKIVLKNPCGFLP